jgi:hypothetical protein
MLVCSASMKSTSGSGPIATLPVVYQDSLAALAEPQPRKQATSSSSMAFFALFFLRTCACLQRFETEPLYRRKIEPSWADSILSSFLRL